MARQCEMASSEQGPLSDESMGKPYGEILRDYEAAPGVQWRFGKPNYARVNKLYFQYRSKVHAAGTLEAVVQKVVKNWEVEVHHVADAASWKTMDPDKLEVTVNGGPAADAKTLAHVGPYNALVGGHAKYDGAMSLEDSNHIFSNVFTEGFAWEVLDVQSGPPNVSMTWRHFGKFTGTYVDSNGSKYVGNGEMVDVHGMLIAKVNDQLRIEALHVYFSPDDMIKPLVTMVKRDDSDRAVDQHDGGDGKSTAAECQPGKCAVM